MRILYFAWLRSKVGFGEEVVTPPDSVQDVATLADWLVSRGAGHAAAFADRKLIRVAVNQDYVPWSHPVRQGDEIAFFPPVTGG
jgi:molybdopterin synthase sulfur carrier subunit